MNAAAGGGVTLGVHVGHDAAAAAFAGSRLVYAEEEERHTRRKSQGGCPWHVIDAGLAAAAARDEDVETVALTWSLERYIACRAELAEHARREGNPSWHAKRQREIATVRAAVDALRRRFPNAEIADFPHHHAHLACAVYFAPEATAGRALGVVADALGDAESLTAFDAPDARGLLLTPRVVLRRPPEQSLGFFYKRAAEAFGFAGSEAPGHLMALAGCGERDERTARALGRLVRRGSDGLAAFEEFDPFRGHGATAARCFPEDLVAALRLPANDDFLGRAPQANAVQRIAEEYLVELLRQLVSVHQPASLFVSGGVFLNCVAVEKLARAVPAALVVCPVKKDSGAAIGAAVLAEVRRHGERVLGDRRRTLRLGAVITGEEAEWRASGRYERAAGRGTLVAQLSADLEAGRVVALADGAGEFGPRALGARSILARADRSELAAHLNRHVKSRHPFQPFAGAFEEDDFRRRYPGTTSDAFMSYAVRFGGPGASIAGILHRDGTCRAQLVATNDSSVLGTLLRESRSEPRVVLNTSLNARGEPMPRTAADVLSTCSGLGIDRIYTPVGRWTR